VRSATLAGELEPDEVGHEQEGVREVEASARIVLLGGELVQRVEGQELQAVPAIELVERCDGVHRLDARRRALVAIVERLAEHAVGTEEGVVDSPRVHADGGDVGRLAERLREARRDAAIQAGHVPVQARDEPNRIVAEAGDLPDLEGACAATVDAAEDDPSARRAEIDRRDGARTHGRIPVSEERRAERDASRDLPSSVSIRVRLRRALLDHRRRRALPDQRAAELIAGRRPRRRRRRGCAGPSCATARAR
jgi:hypothetical protein